MRRAMSNMQTYHESLNSQVTSLAEENEILYTLVAAHEESQKAMQQVGGGEEGWVGRCLTLDLAWNAHCLRDHGHPFACVLLPCPQRTDHPPTLTTYHYLHHPPRAERQLDSGFPGPYL